MEHSRLTIVSTFIRWFALLFSGAHDFQLQVVKYQRTTETCKWSKAEFVNTFENIINVVMKNTFINKFFNGFTRLKERIKLNKGFRP